MIVKLSGRLIEKKPNALILDVNGLCYEVMVPRSVLQRVDDHIDENGYLTLTTYHYFQMNVSRGIPVLVGFFNEVEKEFFEHFITVSGIGPRAAVKALNEPISLIAHAIAEGDAAFLKSLPGVGAQKAKEIIAKLQGKIGKFGLIQDLPKHGQEETITPDWQEEALAILMQLQYKKQEAREMIRRALEQNQNIHTTEELLNQIYKQRTDLKV